MTEEEKKKKKKLKRKLKKKKKKQKKKERKQVKKEKKRQREEEDVDLVSIRKKKKARINGSSGDDDDDDLKKKRPTDDNNEIETSITTTKTTRPSASLQEKHYKIVESSALESTSDEKKKDENNDVTLLLFYQYVDPPWDTSEYKIALKRMEQLGTNLTGRMRVAREGLNCTLTGTYNDIINFCLALRKYSPRGEFAETEFKLTTDLPRSQLFSSPLKIMPVTELVHYGLAGSKAPPNQYIGQHLDPKLYHEKLSEGNTVVIDVRNHYEAAIGHFQPPSSGAQLLDPCMRKSTEFPSWLDLDETKEKLKGKQVLMYCTGGVRCERASSLLKYKMDVDPQVSSLGIKGVYQLQGGIDKYFKEFPNGGYWKGKNYTFDKRFSHVPTGVMSGTGGGATSTTTAEQQNDDEQQKDNVPLSKCESCFKPWDKYRGKRRCPTCGVPSLICKDCIHKLENNETNNNKLIRCDLCVRQGIMNKSQIRKQEQEAELRYEERMEQKGLSMMLRQQPIEDDVEYYTKKQEEELQPPPPNPDNITRLKLKNMCNKHMTEEILMETLPGITHIVWKTSNRNARNNNGAGHFFGQGWVEMESSDMAARAVQLSGKLKPLGRKLYIDYEAPDPKDRWPPPNSRVVF